MMDLPEGWAGLVMTDASATSIASWCQDVNISLDDCYIKQYDYDLSVLTVRKEKDFVLAKLRWE